MPVSPSANSKLIITFYEVFGWNSSVPLGKVEIHTINFRHYMGNTKTFAFDPVPRPEGPPPEHSLARFLLLHRCYATLRFSSLDITMSSLPPISVNVAPSPSSTTSSNNLSSRILSTGPAPALPPRPSLTNTQNDNPPSYKDAVQERSSPPPLPVQSNGNSSPAPALPPRASSPVAVSPSPLSYSQGGPLLATANDTPAPAKPREQSLFGRFANYISGGSSKTPAYDAWFDSHLKADDNCAGEFENIYVDFEMQGHASRLASSTVDFSKYVFLYVPGLYSGRNPFSNKEQKTGEPKLTRHAQRVEELKALGVDARLVVVPNDGTVYSNAHLIRVAMEEAYEETKKPLVMIGYSKGGVDTAAAFSVSPASLIAHVRCFITLFSPLLGSHIASDIEDSMLRSFVHMGIKNLMEADTAAMNDLSMERRSHFLQLYPFIEGIPALSLATSVTAALARNSHFGPPYNYIKSRYGKESDGLVAAQDAIYPGAHKLLLSGMDHVGPRPEYPVFRNHVSFILGVIEVALNRTHDQWEAEQEHLKRLSVEEARAMDEEKEEEEIKEDDKAIMLEKMHSALSTVEKMERQEEAEEALGLASPVEDDELENDRMKMSSVVIDSNVSNIEKQRDGEIKGVMNQQDDTVSDIEEGWTETFPDPEEDFFVPPKSASSPNSPSSPSKNGNRHNDALEASSPAPDLSRSIHSSSVVIEPPGSPFKP